MKKWFKKSALLDFEKGNWFDAWIFILLLFFYIIIYNYILGMIFFIIINILIIKYLNYWKKLYTEQLIYKIEKEFIKIIKNEK